MKNIYCFKQWMNPFVKLMRLRREFIDRNVSKCFLRVMGHRPYQDYPPWIKTRVAEVGAYVPPAIVLVVFSFFLVWKSELWWKAASVLLAPTGALFSSTIGWWVGEDLFCQHNKMGWPSSPPPSPSVSKPGLSVAKKRAVWRRPGDPPWITQSRQNTTLAVLGPGLSTKPSMKDIYRGIETRICSLKTRQDLEMLSKGAHQTYALLKYQLYPVWLITWSVVTSWAINMYIFSCPKWLNGTPLLR